MIPLRDGAKGQALEGLRVGVEVVAHQGRLPARAHSDAAVVEPLQGDTSDLRTAEVKTKQRWSRSDNLTTLFIHE